MICFPYSIQLTRARISMAKWATSLMIVGRVRAHKDARFHLPVTGTEPNVN